MPRRLRTTERRSAQAQCRVDRTRGRFWPCQPYKHREVARLLLSRVLRLDPGEMSPEYFLSLRLRWVPVEINGVVGFHASPEDWTQAQLDTMFGPGEGSS